MGRDTLPFSERSRPWSGPTATLIAVLLMLAVLPSAATVSSPMSAAILEASLRESRLVHVQRERPNPTPGDGVAQRETWRTAQAVAAAIGAGRRLGACQVRAPLNLSPVDATEDALGAMGPEALVRSGVLGLPPPRA